MRVRALPEKGAANAALIVTLAEAQQVPRSAVSLAARATGRVKQVRVIGEGDAIAAIVRRWARR